MPWRTLLVVLASIFATSSARIEYENEIENWVERRPFKIITSWCLKHPYSVTMQVIHKNEWDAMHYHSSKFIPVIHERSVIVVSITHHVIQTEDHEEYPNVLEKGLRLFDGNESSTRVETPRGISGTVKTYGDCMAILMIPDEATFGLFLEAGGFWQRNKAKLVLIVVIPEPPDALCEGNPEKRGWRKSVNSILERFWSNEKVLNVFLSAPTSSCIRDYLFAWNPFVARDSSVFGGLKRLKINPEDPNVDRTLARFAISMKSMNGYPLRVSVFERVPTLFATSDAAPIFQGEGNRQLDIDRITGLDAMILKTLASWMNCSIELCPPKDNQMYGWRMDNGTYVGMIGEIVYQKVDFAANAVFLKDYHTDAAAEFTTPIVCDSICIVVPRAGIIPQWRQIFRCFSPLVWGLLLFNVLIYGLLRHTLRALLRENRPRRSLVEIVIETALIFLSSPQNLPKLNSERILVGFYLVFGVIVIGAFQGTLYDDFANPEHYKDIDTLAELDASGLPIGTGSPNLLDIFGEEEDSLAVSRLRQKVRIAEDAFDSGTINRAAWKQDIAAIERKNDLQLKIDTEFLDEHGDRVLHIVSECPMTYHLTFMVRSGAFFLRRMNVLLRRMVEAGLVIQWYNSTIDSLIMKNHYAMATAPDDKDMAVPFTLKDLQVSFIVWTSGLLLSFVVFIGEQVIFRRGISRGKTIPKIIIGTRSLVQQL